MKVQSKETTITDWSVAWWRDNANWDADYDGKEPGRFKRGCFIPHMICRITYLIINVDIN